MARDHWTSRPAITASAGCGAFFLPYLMTLPLIGMPLCVLAVSLGQCDQTGDDGAFWSIHCPIRGVDLMSVMCGSFVVCYFIFITYWVARRFFESIKSLPCRHVCLPPKSPADPPMTLVLDLDETLVHCTFEPTPNADMVFPLVFNGIKHRAHVQCRPYLDEFLRRVSHDFEVIVFTAGQRVYADKVLDRIDPGRRYIKHRIFQESCLVVEGNYIKDLNVLGRDLRRTVLVDNSPHSFRYQVNNGIPIKLWFNDPRDAELLKLERFLRTLHGVEDVRGVVRERFEPSYSTVVPLPRRRVCLPPKPPADPLKTLVLDLDETLVHSNFEPTPNADMAFPLVFNGVERKVHVRCRPYLEDFLKRVSRDFEVIVFTAGQRVYADKVLDRIDPGRRYIKHRIFQESCLVVEGKYIKDLNILGRDLRRTVLVDNSPHSFRYQVDNGIPIKSWFNDPRDTELRKLERFLWTLHGVEDVRGVVRERFEPYRLVAEA